MHYLIYKTTNLKNGKIYIGCHQTSNINDGYLGSGKLLKRALKKYGEQSFIKEILYDFATVEEMFLKEAELVNQDFIDREDTYNVKLGGEGNWDYVNMSGLGIAGSKKSLELRNTNPEFNELYLKKLRSSVQEYYKHNDGYWKGKNHSSSTVEKMVKIGKARFAKRKELGLPMELSVGKNWMTNDIVSKLVTKEEQPKYLADGWRYGHIITDGKQISLAKLSLQCKAMNNGTIFKQIPKAEQQKYLDAGWKFGRISKPKQKD